MKKWDYDRIGTFFEQSGERIEVLLKAHQEHVGDDFPMFFWGPIVDHVIRDLKTVKALLKRERSSRA